MPRHRLTYNPSTSNCAQRVGERVWKMSGEVQTMTISGQTVIDHVALDRRTLYTNPYLIVTEAEYTKHYYAESQRIASKLGGGWAQAGYNPLGDHVAETPGFRYDNHFVEIVDGMDANALCVGIEPNNFRIIAQFNTIENQLTEDALEANQYFYHPDHLGSSSFITNASGDVDQHLQYLPFGEPWIDQRTSNNIRFTFSGKERDEETGYNYFGARYYNSDISIWLSVDPLSDQAPGWTPYRYGFNNPIIYTDPTGMFEDKVKAEKQHAKAVKKMGEDRVGDIFYNEDKNEYGFQVYKKGEDKYDKGSTNNNGEAICMAYRGTTVYNKASYKNFKSKEGLYDQFAFSGNISFVVSGGASYSFGYVQDKYGDWSLFSALGGGVGLEVGFGLNYSEIIDHPGFDFRVVDFKGIGFQYSVGIGPASISHGGDLIEKGGIPLSGSKYSLTGISGSQGGNLNTLKSLSNLKIKLGGSYQWTKTYTHEQV